MDELVFILLQLLLAAALIGGFLCWLFQGLLCKAQLEVGNKVILITGCDTGIGHELAKYLDSIGFQVFAGCLDTSSEGAQRLRVEASTNLKLVNLDVRRDDHVDAAVHFIQENISPEHQGLYGVVNNAGVCVCGEFEWQTWDQISKQIEVNLLGSMRVIKKCLPLLKAGQGRIINVSSVAGLFGYPGLSTYCASKYALEGFSQVLRLEMEKFNIKVITVQPGDFSKATNLLTSHHRNMNEMWSEMDVSARHEYQNYFTAYHDSVAKSGFTGERRKPLTNLPQTFLTSFQAALLQKNPNGRYLLMPSTSSRIRMTLMTLLPSMVSDYVIAARYRKSLPKCDLARSQPSLNTITY